MFSALYKESVRTAL